MSSNPSTALKGKFTDHSAVIGIIGLGYVGLPLALAFVEKGLRTVGFDVDQDKVEKLRRGEGYIQHLDGGRIAEAMATGLFDPTSRFERLSEPDAILICVPTPLTPQRCPDMQYVQSAAEQVRAHLRRGQLIILVSTTYPGTTDELIKGILEQSGLRCGVDFFLAFSPEREDPGRKDFTTTTTPRVVGGVDEVSGDLAQTLYDQIVAKTVRVSSARVAEASKLTENVFRAVNIALVNELKIVYERLGIDIWEVLDAAATKPFGFMRFNPGPGWGGHCIPVDPFYLAWKAREYGVTSRFVELAGEINVAMPHFLVAKLQKALSDRRTPLGGSKILLVGVAYKKDVDDTRESPALELFQILSSHGAEVSYHDPHIPVLPKTRRHPALEVASSVPLSPETLRDFDAVVIVTDHTAVDYAMILRHAKLVVDARGVFRAEHPNVVKA